MSGFKVDISGDINKRLDEMTEQVKEILRRELNAFGIETVETAKNLAPVDNGTLRQLIGFIPLSNEIGILLYSGASYSAYIEFGTGIFAAAYVSTLPPEVQKLAMTYFVNGRGRIPPQPFLFPAIERHRLDLINRLKAQLG